MTLTRIIWHARQIRQGDFIQIKHPGSSKRHTLHYVVATGSDSIVLKNLDNPAFDVVWRHTALGLKRRKDGTRSGNRVLRAAVAVIEEALSKIGTTDASIKPPVVTGSMRLALKSATT